MEEFFNDKTKQLKVGGHANCMAAELATTVEDLVAALLTFNVGQ